MVILIRPLYALFITVRLTVNNVNLNIDYLELSFFSVLSLDKLSRSSPMNDFTSLLFCIYILL